MLSDASETVSTGELRGPEIDSSILTVVGFVEEQLPVFSQKYINSAIKNEKGLTSGLKNLLQKEAINRKYPFMFEKDPPEEPESGHSPTPDLGAIHQTGITIDTKHYADNESFFSFEAKILGVKDKRRQKEYVIGSDKENGGIERFKKGIHGKKLRYGGMLGYVQKHDFHYWHTTVNSWIDELIQRGEPLWDQQDKLVVNNTRTVTARYETHNSRKGNDSIMLFHLWVVLHTSPN